MSTSPVSLNLRRLVFEDGSQLLRLALRLDALASGAMGVLALAAGSMLADLLGTPAAVLWPLSLFLLAYAAALLIGAARPVLTTPVGWAAVVINLLWIVAGVVAVLTGWLSPTTLGATFVFAQAAVVAVFADLQFLGLRRARLSAA